MVPSRILLLDDLPMTPSGKLDRRALALRELSLPDREFEYIGPRNLLELRLTQIWDELLEVRPIGVRDDFFALGGHSLLAVRMVARIQEELGIDLPLATFFQAATIEKLAEKIGSMRETPNRSLLVALQHKGNKPPLFCVHPVGGNVFCYGDLARYLGQDQPCYGIQSRGVDGDLPPLTSIEAMADAYIEAIRPVQPEGPYYLGGWSMGGIIAFEMAQQLRAQNEDVALVALLDSSNPVYYEDPAPDDDESILAGFNEALAIVLRQMGAADVSPREIAPVQYERLLEVYKANMRAWRNYVPKPYSSRVTLLRADARSEEINKMIEEGWREVLGDYLTIRPVPGNHYTMMVEPNILALAQELHACLAEASHLETAQRHPAEFLAMQEVSLAAQDS
jgi:thioesterase domain-containing protein/acyl carrier protein